MTGIMIWANDFYLLDIDIMIIFPIKICRNVLMALYLYYFGVIIFFL